MTGAAASDAVELIAVGDELLAGTHPDLNSPELAQRLADLGRRVERVTVVGDGESEIERASTEAALRVPLVIVTGGLGPTLDDVTRQAVARAAGRPLVHSEEAWSQVVAWYERAARKMPDSNRRQALIPEGAAILPNRRGTAPGLRVAVGEAVLVALPGPPLEMGEMFERELAPWLAARPVGEGVRRVRRLHLIDLSESVFAERVGDWMARDANPLMAVTAKAGVLSVRLVARGACAEEAQELLDARRDELLERLGKHVFSEETGDLAQALGSELLARELTVALAESCTGGRIAAALTRIPGISGVFREGFVVYGNDAKVERLGVDPASIAEHGAVSPQVAEALARGAAERSGARLALGVTGIAGPGGGSPEKPVGLVWYGLALDGAVEVVERRWPDSGRDRVQEWATAKGLALLLEAARRA